MPVTSGELTIAAVLPQPGAFIGSGPESITGGFEYCLGAEIANMAGLPKAVVKNVAFEGLIAGQTKDFDLCMSDIFITDKRKQTVDFSAPYLKENLAVAVKKGGGISQANLNQAKLGVYTGSIAENFVVNTLKATQPDKSYPTSDALYAALEAGQVDAIVYDLPSSLQLEKQTSGAITVIAQVNSGADVGAVLPKGSANKTGIDAAISAMKASGEIDALYKQWYVPVLGRDPNTIPVWTF